MADISDVIQLLAEKVETVIYPDGIDNPSIIGQTVPIYKGWPIRNKLDEILKGKGTAISIFPTESIRPSPVQTYRDYKQVQREVPTITATVLGNTVTIGGVVDAGKAIMVHVGNKPYSYLVLITDTLHTVAQNLALLIPNSSVIGSVITINFSVVVTAKVISQVLCSRELGRQDALFRIIFWCSDPIIRDKIVPPVDIFFRENYQLVLPDGFYCHIFYQKLQYIDALQLQDVIREDLFFKVQYATTSSLFFTEIGHITENISVE